MHTKTSNVPSAAVPATAPCVALPPASLPSPDAALGNCSVRCPTSHVPVVVPLPSRDGVMPREGQDGPERPPSLESSVANACASARAWRCVFSSSGDLPPSAAWPFAASGARRAAISQAKNFWANAPSGNRKISGSENRLYKNGRTAASESGPPRLNNTTAVRCVMRRFYPGVRASPTTPRSEEHTSELQPHVNLLSRLLL